MKTLIKNILETQFHPLQLKGFGHGIYNKNCTCFAAYSILSILDESFQELFDRFMRNQSYSSYYKSNPDITGQKNMGWSGAPPENIEQLIKEGRFQYISHFFSGCFFEEHWYIMSDFSYHQADSSEDVSERMEHLLQGKSILGTTNPNIENIFDTTVFKMIEDLRDTLTHRMEDYPRRPWLVAYIQKETKEKLNRSFEDYINKSIFIPLIGFLKENEPNTFSNTHTLYSAENYPLIYPQSKEQIIAVVKTINENESKSRLYYFLYQPSTRKIFEWTKPEVRPVPGHHSFYIVDDLSPLSEWDHHYDIFEHATTMDNEVFWKEHVFKKDEAGNFLYLQEVIYKNTQPTIYTDL
ncbi:MAG: hypothetical protein V4539_12115 [Bacteroidota bacterium]